MKGKGNYVPPSYIPLGQSDLEGDKAVVVPRNNNDQQQQMVLAGADRVKMNEGPTTQWTSGICACCDDMQSCCIGLTCPCYLFGKNAEFLGSGTLAGSCMTHFILCGLVNALCCVLTDGILLGLPGCVVACYACGYRKALRSKYDLPEAPCGDLTTHMFCHLCAICQEYREIRDRSGTSGQCEVKLAEVTAPPTQTMESAPKE